MDAIDYLFSLETLGTKFGLDGIRTLLAALGQPQRAYRRVIVAGTNGKGSVTAMTDTALRAAGHRTARYTSPHLVRLEERFVVDGREVETAALAEVAAVVRDAAAGLVASGRLPGPPTFFEATTAVAFELFRRAGVEVAVVEVGLGGRLDATNAEASFAAAITSIDLDHQELLGSSIAAIAREKAGVVHPGMTVVLGDPRPEVGAVVEEVCRARGARLVPAGAAEVRSQVHEGRARIAVKTARRSYGPVQLGLRGRHQIGNAVTAVVLLEELDALGLAASVAAIETGLATARWPGRLEILRLGGSTLLLDGAHNPAGAGALASYLAEAYPAGVPIVFGAMRDKDIPGMLAALAPVATAFALTRARTTRACPPVRLDEMAAAAAPGVPREVVEELGEAVDRALARWPMVCVAGSIYLVGDVRRWLLDRGAEAEA